MEGSFKSDTHNWHLLGAVLYAVCAVSILQETGCSVGVENTQVFWTINACRGNNNTTQLSERPDASVTHRYKDRLVLYIQNSSSLTCAKLGRQINGVIFSTVLSPLGLYCSFTTTSRASVNMCCFSAPKLMSTVLLIHLYVCFFTILKHEQSQVVFGAFLWACLCSVCYEIKSGQPVSSAA